MTASEKRAASALLREAGINEQSHPQRARERVEHYVDDRGMNLRDAISLAIEAHREDMIKAPLSPPGSLRNLPAEKFARVVERIRRERETRRTYMLRSTRRQETKQERKAWQSKESR
jgi:hypothetical protein